MSLNKVFVIVNNSVMGNCFKIEGIVFKIVF